MSEGVHKTVVHKQRSIADASGFKIADNSRHVRQSAKERDTGTQHYSLPEHLFTKEAECERVIDATHDCFVEITLHIVVNTTKNRKRLRRLKEHFCLPFPALFAKRFFRAVNAGLDSADIFAGFAGDIFLTPAIKVVEPEDIGQMLRQTI